MSVGRVLGILVTGDVVVSGRESSMSSVDISAIPQLRRHARMHGDRIAVVYQGREVSYAALFDFVGRYAAALRADGVGPGDRVAYLGANSVTFVTTYFAAIWVGAAFVPVNFRLAGPEIRSVLEDSRPDVVVAEPAQAAMIDPVLTELSVRRPLLVDDDPSISPVDQLSGPWESFGEFIDREEPLTDSVPQAEEDLAALLYTSGTTGRAKGVMLTHGNLWWNWVNVDSVVDTRSDDVSLAIAPLFHIGGFNALTLRTFSRGGTVIIRRAFDPEQTVRDLVEYRVNTMFLVPAMLAAIQRQPAFADADLSALRSTIAAGAPVPPALIASYAQKGVLLQQAWGLTETAPFATYLEAAMTEKKLGSCGVAMPHTVVKVVDPSTLATVDAPLQTGELWVAGPNVSRGYWNNPEATAAAFTPDGWFRTGDIGYADEDGYLFIVDRLKDMIISGGENIYPAELENVLSAHPAVVDVAVVGVPDERWGESVCAVVAMADGAPRLSLDEIRDFAGVSLARYKLPTRLAYVETVPRNGAGKLDKVLIRQLVNDLDPVELQAVDRSGAGV
jgi:fatty-acyl-CoA synthase